MQVAFVIDTQTYCVDAHTDIRKVRQRNNIAKMIAVGISFAIVSKIREPCLSLSSRRQEQKWSEK